MENQTYKIVDEDNNTIDELDDLTLRQAEDALTKLCNENADVYIQDSE